MCSLPAEALWAWEWQILWKLSHPTLRQDKSNHPDHFRPLTGLNKKDRIGDVGGRNFYLHKNDSSNDGLYLQGQEEPGADPSGGDISRHSSSGVGQASGGATSQHQVLTIVISKLDKIGRRTRRIWRFITCNNCAWRSTMHKASAQQCRQEVVS